MRDGSLFVSRVNADDREYIISSQTGDRDVGVLLPVTGEMQGLAAGAVQVGKARDAHCCNIEREGV